MTKNCSICKLPLESEDAAVIAIGAYGTPKCICERCESAIEAATGSHDATEAENAIKELGEALTKGNTGDSQIIETVNSIIESAAERAGAIKNGTYDFSLDEKIDEQEFVIEEDMLESEEDRLLDEKEAKANKIVDTITSWICGIAFLAAVVFFVIKFVI